MRINSKPLSSRPRVNRRETSTFNARTPPALRSQARAPSGRCRVPASGERTRCACRNESPSRDFDLTATTRDAGTSRGLPWTPRLVPVRSWARALHGSRSVADKVHRNENQARKDGSGWSRRQMAAAQSESAACGSPPCRAYPPSWSCGRVAEGGGLLNRYRVVKPYRGFESLRLRQSYASVPGATPVRHAVGTVPPSITYSVPVIALARGETRKAMRSATSFGLAGRPSGMPPNAFMMICLPPS